MNNVSRTRGNPCQARDLHLYSRFLLNILSRALDLPIGVWRKTPSSLRVAYLALMSCVAALANLVLAWPRPRRSLPGLRSQNGFCTPGIACTLQVIVHRSAHPLLNDLLVHPSECVGSALDTARIKAHLSLTPPFLRDWTGLDIALCIGMGWHCGTARRSMPQSKTRPLLPTETVLFQHREPGVAPSCMYF